MEYVMAKLSFKKFLIGTLGTAAISIAADSAAIIAAESSAIPKDGLVAYYPFTDGSLENAASVTMPATRDPLIGTAPDIVNKGASFGTDRFGNKNSAAVFSGDTNCYMEIPDDDAFSIITTGALTISVWVSPATLNFKNAEKGEYVHWMGKGIPQQHEWTFRMYNKDLTESQENRPNRMSAYAFNLKGGLGSGSYVQEELTENEWIHFAARYDVAGNTITLFKNGVQKDQDPLFDETYGVQVENGTAPVRLGTRSLWSFFEGRIDDLRFYNRSLSDEEIFALYNEGNSFATDTSITESIRPVSLRGKREIPNHGFVGFNKRQGILFSDGKKQMHDSKGRGIN